MYAPNLSQEWRGKVDPALLSIFDQRAKLPEVLILLNQRSATPPNFPELAITSEKVDGHGPSRAWRGVVANADLAKLASRPEVARVSLSGTKHALSS